MIDFNSILSYLIAPIATAVLAWVLARRKYSVETDGMQLDNLEKSLDIYKKMVEDLSLRVEMLSKGLNEIREENDLLLTENRSLKRKINSMAKEIKDLKNYYNEDNSST
ncbi:MAG: hypothetical protein LC105_06185 [Chitinophagales bacterium]|nr:hypothetical protein [Chitinophagales bacterium]